MSFIKNLSKAWRFIAFYTPKYQQEAIGLVSSLSMFQVSYSVIPIPDKGGWDMNTNFKATFVSDCLNAYTEHLVYIDADARLEKYPTLFDNMDCDIAFWRNPWHGRNNELASGTVYFQNNAISRKIVDIWCNLCSTQFDIWDQVKLDKAVSLVPEAKVQLLPVEYYAIFDHPTAQGKDAVIKHYQASRRLR